MMSFVSYLVNGISLGSIYALIALGYTMVYGIAKMLNFAHGDIIMVGGFTVFTAMSTAWCPVWLSVVIGIVVCTVLGVVIEKVAYKPLRNAPPLAVLITAIGVSYLLQNLALLIFGSAARNFTSVAAGAPPFLTIFDDGRAPRFFTAAPADAAKPAMTISMETFLSIVVSVVIMVALTLFINKTKAGKAMLAVSEDKGAAQLMGIPGAMIGGVLLGVIEQLSKAYISSQLSDAIVFLVLIIVLVVRPTGILGKKINEKV